MGAVIFGASPDLSGYVTIGTPQTITGAKTFNAPVVIGNVEDATGVGLTMHADSTTASYNIIEVIDDSDSSWLYYLDGQGVLNIRALLIGDTVVNQFNQILPNVTSSYINTLPDAGGTLVSTALRASSAAYTMFGYYIFSRKTTLYVGGNTTYSHFCDNGTPSKVVALNVAGVSASTTRVWYAIDTSGVVGMCGYTVLTSGQNTPAGTLGKVNATGQTAAFASAKLGNAVNAGLYMLHCYLKYNSGTGSAQATFSWNDGSARTQACPVAGPLSAAGYDSVSRLAYLAAGQDITLAVAITGSPNYDLFATVEAF